MKKTLLSLAALAFVVAGSVATVSCGDDNPTPEPPTPPVKEQEVNTIRFNEKDSPLDFSYYELVTRDYTVQGNTITDVVVYNYPGGGYANGYYVNVGYNLVEGNADTYHYAFVLVPNPSITVQDGNITSFGTPVLPHEAQEISWRSAAVQINGETYQSSQGNMGEGSVKINTLALQNGEGTTSFESKFVLGSDSFNVKYNGKTFLTTYKQPTQRGVKPVGKLAALEEVKSLEVSNVLVK